MKNVNPKDAKKRIKTALNSAKLEVSKTKRYLRTAARTVRGLEAALKCEHTFEHGDDFSSCTRCGYFHLH